MQEIWQLWIIFLKIGAFTFGGGYAMLELVRQEALFHGWLTQQELIDFLAVSESTPGSFAVNVATFIGNKTLHFLGAFIATLAVVLPSFLLILSLSGSYEKYHNNRYVQSALKGIKPCVIILISLAALSILQSIPLQTIGIPSFYFFILIALMYYFLIKQKRSTLFLISFSALAGILAGYFGLIS